jgi:hypothetical protein
MPCHEYKFFLTKKTLENAHNYGYRVKEGYRRVACRQVRLVANASKEHFGCDARLFVLAQAVGEFSLGKFLVVIIYDEWVVQIDGTFRAA